MNYTETMYLLLLFIITFFSFLVLFNKSNIGKVILSFSIIFFVLIVGYLSSALTGHPRNIEKTGQGIYFFENDSFYLKDFLLDPSKNIYLWLINDANMPISYRLPWDEKLAQALHQATENAKQNGNQVKISLGDMNKLNNKNNIEHEYDSGFSNDYLSIGSEQVLFYLKD